MTSTPKVISVLGRPGCGKGTQIEIIAKREGFSTVKTGEMLRERAEKEDFIGGKIKETLERGGLIPTPLVFHLWMPRLIEFYSSGKEGIIFDGNPRKLYEAYMLEEVLEMFGWRDNFCAFHLKISEEEAQRRLKERKRSDDKEEEIKERMAWFKEEVEPVISYYREKGVLIEIDGERTVEEVDKDIYKKLNNFFESSR